MKNLQKNSFVVILCAIITTLFWFSCDIENEDVPTKEVYSGPTYTLSGTLAKADNDVSTTGIWCVWLSQSKVDYEGSGANYKFCGSGYTAAIPVNYTISGIIPKEYRITAVIYDTDTVEGPAYNNDWIALEDYTISADTTRNYTLSTCTACGSPVK